jgi:V8-like Glu-specific endopeptidase
MSRLRRRSVALIALVALVALPALAAPVSAAGPPSEHERIVAYWTRERIQSARPLDVVLQPNASVAQASVGAPIAQSSPATTLGSEWPDGVGKVYTVVGRVLFSLTSGNYICSGTIVTDPKAGLSVVLTAAHCAYDQGNRQFATNWMFFPEFDTTPSYDCAAAVHGCWTASRLVVHRGYAQQPGFTSTALQYDWAFAVTREGGKAGTQLDSLGSFPIAFTSYAVGTPITAVGYPAGGKYSPGNELIYSSGSLEYDPYQLNRTYRLASDLTGGSSGGPWLTGFDADGNSGTLSSVNSYVYVNVNFEAMHGPMFNSKTQATWNSAISKPTGNAIVK